MIAQQHSIGALLNGRYRILRVLGQGGVGTVYLAQHIQLEMKVALKQVRDHNLDELEYQDALEQCRREGQMLVHLAHPHLPKVTDAFIEDDSFYLVREYVEGVTAEDCLYASAMQPLDVHQVLQWGLQIATVLSYLHTQEPPIIFRDLKPDNIIVQPNGMVKLVDFGIARRFNAGASNDTTRLGSLGFSPPEQFGLKQTDQRSDLYSLGATLHHLLTGYDPSCAPFRLPSAAALNPLVPVALSELIDRCLSLDSAMRPADAQEVLHALTSIRDSGTASEDVAARDVRQILLEGSDQAVVYARPPAGNHRSWLFISVLILTVIFLTPVMWLAFGKGHSAAAAGSVSPAPVRNNVMASAGLALSTSPSRHRVRHRVRKPRGGARQPLPRIGSKSLRMKREYEKPEDENSKHENTKHENTKHEISKHEISKHKKPAYMRMSRRAQPSLLRERLLKIGTTTTHRPLVAPATSAPHQTALIQAHRSPRQERGSKESLPGNQFHDTDLGSVLGTN